MVQNSSYFKGVQKTETAGFCLEGEQLICGFGKMKLARLHPNFNYMFTFEMMLRGWEEKEHFCEQLRESMCQ